MRSTHYGFTLMAIAAIACVLSFAAAPAQPVLAQDDFKTAQKDYQQAKRDLSRTGMERAVARMAGTNDKDAAKFLLSELTWDQRQRASKRAGLPGAVRDKIMEALAAFSDEDSVSEIGKAALGLNSSRNPVLALDQFDFFRILAGMTGSESADNTLRAALADTKNAYIKCAALEAVRQAGATRFVDDVVAILHEDNAEWATRWVIVPINVYSCLEDIVTERDTDNVIKVVEGVIAWEKRKAGNDERVRYFGGKMLAKLTGETADISSVHFWEWWVAQMKALGKVDSANRPAVRADRTAAVPPPPVFDAPPVGKRFVFVVDLSDSMKLPLEITLDEMERRRERRGPVSGDRRGAKDEEVDDQDDDRNNPLRRLPWKEIKIKMDLGRHELSRAVREFAGDREFAIITYGTEHECITGGFVKATQANCDKWADAALKLDYMGMTNIHGALMRSLRITARSENKIEHPAVDPEAVLQGADCIIFMTDGWASWDDASAIRVRDRRRPQDQRETVGDGPFIYGEDIWPDILRHNMFRKVIIHTVGIGNHDKELLQNLARRTGGTYVDWGFNSPE